MGPWCCYEQWLVLLVPSHSGKHQVLCKNDWAVILCRQKHMFCGRIDIRFPVGKSHKALVRTNRKLCGSMHGIFQADGIGVYRNGRGQLASLAFLCMFLFTSHVRPTQKQTSAHILGGDVMQLGLDAFIWANPFWSVLGQEPLHFLVMVFDL